MLKPMVRQANDFLAQAYSCAKAAGDDKLVEYISKSWRLAESRCIELEEQVAGPQEQAAA